MAAAVRLVDLRTTPLQVDEVIAAVSDEAAGGLALFVGTVRDHDGGKAVVRLGYSSHPQALTRLRKVCEDVAAKHPTVTMAAVHRLGNLVVGDLAVVAAVSSAHRGEAFDACRELVDTLKSTVPIWKHQEFADGSDEWVGTP